MPDIPRINGVIKALEQGHIAFVLISPTSKPSQAGSWVEDVTLEWSTALAPLAAKLCSSSSTGADRRTHISSHGFRVWL